MSVSFVLNSLKGLSAVVSGGSSGLGWATVQRLANLGCSVAICDLNEPTHLPTKDCFFLKADICNEKEVERVFEDIEKRSQKLDIVVNCVETFVASGMFDSTSGTYHSIESFRNVLKVNNSGTFNMVRYGASLLFKNEPNAGGQRGLIVNTAHTAAWEGTWDQGAFAASKAGIAAMTLPLARDLCRTAIRVVAIAPGLFASTSAGLAMQEKQLSQVPFPTRMGHPDEFAHLVQFVIENPMINGEVLRIDGAFRAQH